MVELDECRRLLDEADELRHESPALAVRLAETTRDLVASLSREAVGAPRWLTLQADAWAVWGSALRSVAELRQAEAALNVALAFLDAPELAEELSPLAHPRLAQRAANLRSDQGRFDEALVLIDEAFAEFERYGALDKAAVALIDRGVILGSSGRKAEALACLGEALDRLDPHASPRNFLAAVHNTAVYLHEVAADPEVDRLALEWLKLADRCHAALPEGLNLLKLRTLKALTSIRLGWLDEGIHELWETQERCRHLGALYEQAIILLHLAATYLREGLTGEVKRVAGQLFPVFRSLRIDREASAALMLFYSAAHANSATLDLIDEVSETVRRVQLRGACRPSGTGNQGPPQSS